MESAATKEFKVRYPNDGEQSIIIKSNWSFRFLIANFKHSKLELLILISSFEGFIDPGIIFKFGLCIFKMHCPAFASPCNRFTVKL